MAVSDRTPDENRGQNRWRRNGMLACWKPSWSLASLARLNKELRHCKTVCLQAFVCMVRCQYRNSGVSEEFKRSMVRKGECNWITVTLGWPFITRTHTHFVICPPLAPSQIHMHSHTWPLNSLVYSFIRLKTLQCLPLMFFFSLGMLQRAEVHILWYEWWKKKKFTSGLMKEKNALKGKLC